MSEAAGALMLELRESVASRISGGEHKESTPLKPNRWNSLARKVASGLEIEVDVKKFEMEARQKR